MVREQSSDRKTSEFQRLFCCRGFECRIESDVAMLWWLIVSFPFLSVVGLVLVLGEEANDVDLASKQDDAQDQGTIPSDVPPVSSSFWA